MYFLFYHTKTYSLCHIPFQHGFLFEQKHTSNRGWMRGEDIVLYANVGCVMGSGNNANAQFLCHLM